MTNQELIDQQYLADRYLQYLSLDDLVQRLRDILSNILTLRDDGKGGLHDISGEGRYWFILFCNVMTEFDLRGCSPPDGFLENAKIPKLTWPDRPAGSGYRDSLKLNGDFLFKFSKASWLQDTLDNGTVYLSPATRFDDPTLNPAIQDKELEVTALEDPTKVKIFTVDQESLEEKNTIDPIGNVSFLLESPSDYYVICLTSSYNIRLFTDFDDYDACLVIREPERFVKSVFAAAKNELPGYIGRATFVSYYDPLRIEKLPVSVFFHKHFRYSYQREYRVVFRPPEPIVKLQPHSLKVDGLSEYCELIKL